MTKKEYIKRQIAKTNKKDYENYVVTRIIHFLDDLDIKFITQQYVKRPLGYALADLYFPQLNTFIEVDEAQHISNLEADKQRDRDFEDAVGITPLRINVAHEQSENKKQEISIEEVNSQVSSVVVHLKKIKLEKIANNEFEPWDIDKEINPDTWIQKGEITLDDKVAFRTIVDACKCMGLNYAGYQRAGANHPHEENTLIWFPKLYPNGTWNNSYDEINGIIKTSNIKNTLQQNKHVKDRLKDNRKRRIVFARVKDNLGDIKYRFRGVFEMDVSNTNLENGVVWNRVSTTTKTYDYRNN